MATYDLTKEVPSIIIKDDILNCPYSGAKITITLTAGDYKFEVWGAQGGSYSSYYGGYGGYSVGNIKLEEDTIVYLYAGGQPTTNTSTGSSNSSPGGFNGGGSSKCRSYSGTTTYCQGGGGGSDIRIGEDSLYARVIVAGGGAGSASYNMATYGYGGGTTSGGYSGYTSGQTSAGTSGSFGKGGNSTGSYNYKYGAGGGGGGWYGGGCQTGVTDSSTSYKQMAAGGSGYVYTEETAGSYPDGCLLEPKYYLTEASTKAGNTSITSPTGTITTGRQGHGYIRITKTADSFAPGDIFKYNGSSWKKVGEKIKGETFSFSLTKDVVFSIKDVLQNNITYTSKLGETWEEFISKNSLEYLINDEGNITTNDSLNKLCYSNNISFTVHASDPILPLIYKLV